MLQGVANDRPFLVSDATNWIYAGTGLHTYSGNGQNNVITSGANQNALPGIVGYEFDARASTTPGLSAYVAFEPAGLATVGHSFVPASDGNASNTWSDATLYTRPGRRNRLRGGNDSVVMGCRHRLQRRLLRMLAGDVPERGDAADHVEHHQPVHRPVGLRSPAP